MPQQISTWMKGELRDVEMNEYHRQFWRTFLERVPEADLSPSTVLDFGCGCGGFLRFLYEQRPFRSGIGIDIAVDSLKEANARKGTLPVDYFHAAEQPDLSETVDYAFSYEVIYLVPDLDEHAQYMRRILKPGGVYYPATGCHTANPLWPAWKPLVESQSNLPVPDYSPEDFVEAFSRAGFSAGARRLAHSGFAPADVHRDHFPTVTDAIRYYEDDILVFRFAKA